MPVTMTTSRTTTPRTISAIFTMGAKILCVPHVRQKRSRPYSSGMTNRWIVALLLPALLDAQAPPTTATNPTSCQRDPVDVVLQLVAGYAGGVVGGMGVWSAIDDPEAPDRKVKGDAGYQPNANTGYAIGSWVGSTVAVFGAGRLLKPRCGSLKSTAIGTGSVSLLLLFGREEPYLPIIGVIFGAPLQALAGVATFHRW
jgi:hypothetical protein